MSRSDPPRGGKAPRDIGLEFLSRCWEETTPRERLRLLRSAVAESRDAHAREANSQSPPNDRTWEEMTSRDRLRLELSSAENKRDRLAEGLALLQWLVEQLRRADSDAYEPPDHQVARDSFILESYRRGKKLSVIRCQIRSHPDWRPLGTDSAVRHAMMRHCRRLGIKPPTRR